jgi:FkbM family methyltransferase
MLRTTAMLKKSLKDAYCIARAPLPLASRLRLLLALVTTILGGKNLLGWKVRHLGRHGLRLLFSEIFARQEYLFHTSRPDPVILDCGANIGMATLYFKWLYPEAHIAAFEPDPVTFKILEQNVSDNGLSHVATHNIALAGEEKDLPFHVPEPGSLMMSALASRGGAQSVDVQARRLSSFIYGEVDLLKLDIEGLEGEVIRELAASGKLSSIREAIIEVHHNLPETTRNLSSILSTLENAGFRYNVVDCYPRSRNCGSVQDIMIRAEREDSKARKDI